MSPFGQGGLLDVLLKAVRERTQLAVQRNDFKPDQLPPHLFMNLRVVDEHGRQLGMGRDVAGLKAELGGQARTAFQALAALKRSGEPAAKSVQPAQLAPTPPGAGVAAQITRPASAQPAPAAAERYTAWTFGELPELLEIRKAGQTLVGFPALVDQGSHVEVEVFDEPEAAALKHRAGLRRLVALQIKEPLKYLEKNIPELTRMAGLYMALGTLEELREQIVAVALDRAFLAEPLPVDERSFKARVDEGRARLNLIAAEVARQAATVLAEHAAAVRKLKDSKAPRELADDIGAQLQRLVGRRFLHDTPWPQLQHLPRYLKGVVLRLDKWRTDPARDSARLAELRPLEQRWARRVAELRGASHARLDDYRWLLEELRVSLFAQELRTPQPVSAKRLDKLWAQLNS
jgi:ATP-dependent helicase HrpA